MHRLAQFFIILAFAASVLPMGVVAQQASGVLTGRVVDGSRDYALAGVRVRVVATDGMAAADRVASTDTEGRFRIERLAPGQYTLVLDSLGYAVEEASIEISSGSNPDLAFSLQPARGEVLDRIEVRAVRDGTARALNRQRAADNARSVVAADFVGQFPDKNIAEATQRLPGIGIQRDQGEGRYVNIRGTPVEFANVTVDGVSVPSPNAGTRAVDLDTIPSDIISLLEVNKTLTPDMDAEAIAGTINIITQGAFDANRRFLRTSLASGRNDLGGGDRFEGSFTYGDVFGADGRIGLILGANHSRTERATHNIESDWTRLNPGGLFTSPQLLPEDTDLKDYDLVRRKRTGFNARMDFKLRESDRAFLSFSRSEFADKEFRHNTTLDYDDRHRPGSDAVTGIVDGFRMEKALRDRTVINEIDIFTLGSTHYLGEARLDLKASYSVADQYRPIASELTYRTGRHRIAYDYTNPDLPVFTLLDGDDQPIPGNLPTLIDDLAFQSFDPRSTVASEEQEIALQADIEFPFAGLGDESQLKFGLKARLREKDNDEDRERNRNVPDAPAFATLAGSRDSNNFGRFNTGPIFRNDAIRANRAIWEGPGLAARIEQSVVSDYDVEEDIYAGYGMMSSNFGRLGLVAGLRIEHTDFSGRANAFDEATETAAPVSAGGSYTRLFPGINLRYDFAEDIVLRAAYTTGISRPNFEVLAPFTIFEDSDGVVERGNPDLDPTYSHNFDLMAEYYLRPAGLVSVGLFYKRLSDTIFVAESLVEGGPFDGFRQERPENGGDGRVYGAEFGWSQALDFLPAPLDGLGVNASYTWTRSDADKPFDLGSSALPGTSRHTTNLSLFYDHDRFTARVAYNRRSRYLNAFNVGDPELDNFWDTRAVVDITGTVRITESVRLFSELNNLTDSRQRRIDGAPSRVNELEEFGRSWIVGFRYAM